MEIDGYLFVKTALLYSPHPTALTVLAAEIDRYARAQREVFVGTAGSVLERTNASAFRFYARQYYDGDKKKREHYVAGPVGNPDADAQAQILRERIAELREIVKSLRMLGREGFNLVDAKTYATLASLRNHGIFAAGGMLIGSHAFGVLLNQLGARAAPYATDDIDIARRGALAFEAEPERSFLEMLRGSGLPFVEVPEFDHRTPSTSFKRPGASRFHVDLLVPSPDNKTYVVPVPELRAHATALPHLTYLLSESSTAVLMAREGCCTVRVPVAERFAVHKFIVSQLRVDRGAKSGRDIHQASVLCAFLSDHHPGAIRDAIRDAPPGAQSYLRRGIATARHGLEGTHPRAWEELSA